MKIPPIQSIRQNLKIRFALILTAILLVGCSAEAGPTQTPKTGPATPPASPIPVNITPTQVPTLTSPPTATPTPVPEINSSYTIEAELDYGAHRLQVRETIRYANTSGELLNELVLMVDPMYYPGAFQLNSLTWEDGQPVEGANLETGKITLPLRQPLPDGDTITLLVDYQLNIPTPVVSPTIRPIPFGYTERQTNLVDWYPFVAPYIPGKGWIAHPAGYYGEHLVYDIADYEVSIRFSEPNPNLVIAASAPANQDGDWFRYSHPAARNFVWSVSPYYQVLSAEVGDVDIASYAFAGQEAANQAVLQTTAQALGLYSKIYGPYPRPMLSVVEADFLDGMEYDGLYFLSKGFYNLYTGTPGEYLIAIAAHETAHQWWYALVGNDQALEPWLDEALSTYSERLYYENLSPEALDWWWTYRVNYYNPRGWVNNSIYNPQGEVEAYRAYRDAVYLNGAVFLEELRKLIGDQSFFAFLKEYVQQYSLKQSTAESFFSLLNQYTQVDVSSLINKYFFPNRKRD